MILNNCEYNCIKLLHELSSLAWFLEKHALKDAEIEKKLECKKLLEQLKNDLDTHITAIKKMQKCHDM